MAKVNASPRTHVYKKAGGRKYRLAIFGAKSGRKRPAIVWFSGGGWQWGGLGVYERQCAYLATRGIVGVCAEFRAAESGRSYSAGWAAEDAKSAVRWLRVNHHQLGIDPDRIVAAGESSGATMAVQTAVSPGFEAPNEPAWISSTPNALLLFDPAMGGKALDGFFRRMGLDELTARRLTPNLNLCGVLPPSLLVYGLKDFLRPGLDEFVRIARRQKLPVKVIRVPGQPHGFMKLSPWQERSLEWVERWLGSLGYLEGKCRVAPPRLPFAWRKPVFSVSLPVIRETAWFGRISGRLRGLDRRIYQLCFAPLTRRRFAVLVSLRPGAKASPALAQKVRRAAGAGLTDGLKRFDPGRQLVVSFTEFPYRHVGEPE